MTLPPCWEWHEARQSVSPTAWARNALREGPGVKYVIEASAVRELLAACRTYGDLVGLKEAARLLGMTGQGCAGLISCGLLPEVPVMHRISLGLCIRRADVDALLAAFDLSGPNLPVVDRLEKGHPRVAGPESVDGFGNRAFVAGVLAGELRPVAVWSGAEGIARYLFLHQVSDAWRRMQSASVGPRRRLALDILGMLAAVAEGNASE